MFGISGEHLLVLSIVLLVFGPRRLPELGNTLGKAIRNFKDALAGVEEADFRKLEAEVKKPKEKISEANSMQDSAPQSLGKNSNQAQEKTEALSSQNQDGHVQTDLNFDSRA